MPASPTITRVYWTAFKVVGASQTQINNVQEVQIQFGRRLITDLITAGTATVYGRRPDLLPSLLIGDVIRIRMNYTYAGQPAGPDPSIQYEFRVADLQVEYGETSTLDTWVLELEDAFAYLGRASLPTTTIASGTSTATAANTIANAAGITMALIPGSTTTSSAQTVTGQSALDVFQNLVNTEAAWVYADALSIWWYPRNVWQNSITYYDFRDNNTAINYNDYRVASLADNYADQVVVKPRGSSDVIVGTGIFSYNLDSFSFDTGEANNLANYWRSSLDVDDTSPRQISALVNGNNRFIALSMVPGLVGMNVRFRDITTTSVVTGAQIFGTVESTNVTFFLSSVNFQNYLVLDSQVFGYLDFNKLGWA